MKNLLTIICLFCGLLAGRAIAQDSPEINREKMKIFESWAGQWKGESKVLAGPHQGGTSIVDETVEFELNGLILVVEGIGRNTGATGKEQVVHHAIGILSYDRYVGEYKFRSYTKEGYTTDAWWKILGENRYQWGFDIPTQGQMRFTIALNPGQGTWDETGEFSSDGEQWHPFMEMHLTRVK